MNAIDKLPTVILEKVKTLFFVVQCLEDAHSHSYYIHPLGDRGRH